MKKLFLISSIVISILLLILFGCIFVLSKYPGIPFLISAKFNIKTLDINMETYNSQAVLLNYNVVDMPDYTFRVPDICEKKSESESLWIYSNEERNFTISAFSDYSEADFISMWDDLNEDDLNMIFKNDVPQNNFEQLKYIYSINSQDFNVSSKVLCVFLDVMLMQREIISSDYTQAFCVENDNIKGILLKYEDEKYEFRFYSTTNLNKCYYIIFTNCDDLEQIFGTINSIQVYRLSN